MTALNRDGEAEAVPSGSAEPAPLSVSVFDDAPQRVGPGFPDSAGAVVFAIFADFAPGTVWCLQDGVVGWLAGALAAETETGGLRERSRA